MTNHTLSAKIPSVSLREPYVFARDSLLIRRGRAECIPEISPEDWERPLVCSLFENIRTFFERGN